MTTNLPGSIPRDGHALKPDAIDFEVVQASPEFRKLRRMHRRFAFPVVLLALVWYFGFILLAAYAHDFMSVRVSGNITLGLVLGLSQIVTTFAIALLYAAYSNRVVDPAASQLRTDIQGRIDDSIQGAQA